MVSGVGIFYHGAIHTILHHRATGRDARSILCGGLKVDSLATMKQDLHYHTNDHNVGL